VCVCVRVCVCVCVCVFKVFVCCAREFIMTLKFKFLDRKF
jgi:hypothetical protein